MKKILVLGASILQVPAIKKAKNLGHFVICVDFDPDAIGFKYADTYYVESTLDYEAVLSIAKKEHIDGILTIASDRPLPIIARVCHELNLPGISIESSKLVTNKYKMRSQFAKYNVPSPIFHLVNTKNEIIDILNKYNKPLILKPVSNSGSRGVNLLDPNQEVDKLYESIENSIKNSEYNEMILEEFMVGQEYSVEGISIDGEYNLITVTEKQTTGDPFFVEMAHKQPATLTSKEYNNIKSLISRACSVLLIDNSVSHAEIIITDEGPKIVEIGSRLGGDSIASHLVPLSTGIDMVTLAINQALDQEIIIDRKFMKYSGIKFLPSDPGVFKSVENIEQASGIEGVAEIQIVKNNGDILTEIEDSNSRIGYIIASADSELELKNIIDDVMSLLDINIIKN